MNVNLKVNFNNELHNMTAEIKGVNVYIESPFGRSVIQLKDKAELDIIEPYQQVIQGMADAFTALKYPIENETVESNQDDTQE